MEEFELLRDQLHDAVVKCQDDKSVLAIARKSLELLRKCIAQFEEQASFIEPELRNNPDNIDAMEIVAVLQALDDALLLGSERP